MDFLIDMIILFSVGGLFGTLIALFIVYQNKKKREKLKIYEDLEEK